MMCPFYINLPILLQWINFKSTDFTFFLRNKILDKPVVAGKYLKYNSKIAAGFKVQTSYAIRSHLIYESWHKFSRLPVRKVIISK